jgi:hypothetical protein
VTKSLSTYGDSVSQNAGSSQNPKPTAHGEN